MPGIKKDLFISHASEDKDGFVRPLVNLLREYGVDLWYDEFELKIGSNIRASIEKGIKNSRYGLIILSKPFFKKNWTEYELDSFAVFEVQNKDVLLPVWHEVTLKDVKKFSPYLANMFALNSAEGIEQLSVKLIETVRPDIFSEIHRKLLIEQANKNAKLEQLSGSKVKYGPLRHPKLSENISSRIRLIRSALWLCNPHSLEFWMDGFRRDLNIESEIRYWEKLSTCFLEIITGYNYPEHHKGETKNIFTDLFSLLLSIRHPESEIRTKFTKEFVDFVTASFVSKVPLNDKKEASPFSKQITF